MNKAKTYPSRNNYTEGSKTEDSGLKREKHDNSNTHEERMSFKCKLVLIISLMTPLIIAGAFAIYYIFYYVPPTILVTTDPPNTGLPITDPPESTCSNNCDLYTKFGPLERQEEYMLKINVNDLFRIYVNQKSYEDIKKDGILTKTLLDRKTNYDIFIMEEIPATEEAKYFYNKIYVQLQYQVNV